MDWHDHKRLLDYRARREAVEPLFERLADLQETQPTRFVIHYDGSMEKQVMWSEESKKYRDELLKAISDYIECIIGKVEHRA